MRSYLSNEITKTSRADVLKNYDSETALDILRKNIENNLDKTSSSSEDDFYSQEEQIVFEEIPTKFSVGDVARDLKEQTE